MFSKKKKEAKMAKIKRNRLRLFNNGLTVVVLIFSVYIIVLPFLPFLSLWWDQFSDSSNGYRYESQLAKDAGQNIDLALPPNENTIVVPSIQIDNKVAEGADISALAIDGVWRRPHTSTPDQGGNTVFVGHRFSYSNPATFYHLDKMEKGEKFAVWWNQQEYIYEVTEIVIVEATEISIEGPSVDPIVTLYTCTPIWTAAQRLVVRGKLINDPTGNLLPNSTIGANL